MINMDRGELMEESSMNNWYPRVKDLSIKTPDTYKLELEKAEDEGLIDFNQEAASKAVRRLDGPPAFIRTDCASDKHDMGRTSKIMSDDEDHIQRRVNRLVEHNLMIGVPFTDLYIREWIDIAHDFKAFDQLPIGYEVRYFIHEGDIVGKHFYWPEDAIRFRGKTEKPDDWEEQLEKSRENTMRLTNTLERKIDPVLQEFDEGFWSVDFAFTDDGEWQLIDMARGEVSWHPRQDEVERSMTTPEEYQGLY